MPTIWIVAKPDEKKIYQSAKDIAKIYKTSIPAVRARSEIYFPTKHSRIFGTDRIIRIRTEYGHSISLDDYIYKCDSCNTPVRDKDVICDNCDNASNKK